MPAHTITQFENDLEYVRSQFLLMGGVVESMIRESILALIEGDMALVDKVKEHEKEVNAYEVAIDGRISQVLARQQPAAIDLRSLISVSKMLTDMERSGDEAEKIATIARRSADAHQQVLPVVELGHISNKVAYMLRKMLDAFVRQDAVAAAEVVRSDKDVDKEWKAALRHLVTYMMEDPRTISHSIDLIFVARSLERIGDHTKNMAERVIYMVHGADVRHTGVKNAERLARGEDSD